MPYQNVAQPPSQITWLQVIISRNRCCVSCVQNLFFLKIVYDSNSWKNTLMMCFFVVEFKKEISENLRIWSNSHGICRCEIIYSVCLCLSVSTDHSSRQEIPNLSTLRTTREFSHAPTASWVTEHTPVCSVTVRGGGYNVVHSAQIPLPYSPRSICAHTHTYICTYIYHTCVLYICICIMRLCLYSVFPYDNKQKHNFIQSWPLRNQVCHSIKQNIASLLLTIALSCIPWCQNNVQPNACLCRHILCFAVRK